MINDIQSKLCPGEGDLQRISGTKPLLHHVPGQPYEKEAQGWPTCHKDHGWGFQWWFYDAAFPVSSIFQENVYNAWEEDIAVVNIFFGKETVMGEKRFIISIKPDFYFRIREEH